MSKPKEFDWFDRPSSRKLMWNLLYAFCGLLVLTDVVLYFLHKKHPHFAPIDSMPGSMAVIGFVACALSILVAKFVGRFLKKRPDYYQSERDKDLNHHD